MEVKDKTIVITGGASGIGRAMAQRFTNEGAKQIVIADLNADGLQAVADEIGARAIPTNVAKEDEVIDAWCQNLRDFDSDVKPVHQRA